MLRVFLPSFAAPWRGAEPGGVLLPALASPASPNPPQPLKSLNLKGELEGKGKDGSGGCPALGSWGGERGAPGTEMPPAVPRWCREESLLLSEPGVAGACFEERVRSSCVSHGEPWQE